MVREMCQNHHLVFARICCKLTKKAWFSIGVGIEMIFFISAREGFLILGKEEEEEDASSVEVFF